MTIYLVHTNTQTLRSNLQREAKAFASLATSPIAETYDLYANSGTNQIHDAMNDYLALNKSVTNVTIVDLTGKTLYAFDQKQRQNISKDQASNFKPVYATLHDRLQYVVYPYFSVSGAHPFSIVYTISNQQVDAAIQHEVGSLVLFGTLSLLFTSTLTYFLINQVIVKPIREVSREAGLISAGNLEQQIHVHGNDEVASLGNAVNAMADSLKDSISKLQEIDKVKSEFMAITSHNLRTPLTIINGYLESSSSFDTVEKLQKAMNRIGDSVKRLGSFSEDVLTISSIELGENAPRTTIKIGDFMQKIIDQTTVAAQLQQLQLTTNVQTNAEITVSEPYLRSAVWNLIDNSLKFTPQGGAIMISVKLATDIITIEVSDTGIGIAADEIPKLFTKFHRATSVMKYDYEGTGIGLYATKIIVEQQGGTVGVVSQEGHGSTFTISLPVVQTEPAVHTS